MSRLILLFLLFACGAATGFAQDTPVRRVEVQVVSILDGVVRLDHGRRSGIASGDRVRLFALGQPTLEGTVLSVRENTCQAEFNSDTTGIEPGTTGEVLAAVDGVSNEELPWTSPAEDFDPTRPLLLGRATTSEERPPSWRGRLYFQSEYTNVDAPSSSSYLFGNVGLDLAYENPFGNGGRLHLNADGFSRTQNLDVGFEIDDSRLRFDRLSYAFGGTRDRADRWQFGRFLQYEFPELGVIDGAEYSHRLDNGSRIGGSFGYLPRTLDDFRLENDLQAALFYRHLAGPNEEVALGASYQKTWHGGNPDRDLILTTIDVHPSQNWTIFGTSWVDLYGGDAVNKDAGLELTQLITGATWANIKGQGATVSFTQTRWPELLRDLYVTVDPSLLSNGQVDRIRIQGWSPLSEHFRLRSGIHQWSDQDDSGGGGNVFLGMRDLLWDRGELGIELYVENSKFDDLIGARLTGYKNTDFGIFRGTVDSATTEGATFSGPVDQGQLRLRASWDRAIGLEWYLSIYAQTVSLDAVDTTTLGFNLQWSF